MLVLSRKINERICIGDDIKIQVIRHNNGKTTLGIEAPRGLPVHREEVYDAIQRELEEAEATEVQLTQDSRC